jgi:hypothetical protein
MHITPKKTRVNKGKHIIISTDVHHRLKIDCVDAGVEITQVADTALLQFVDMIAHVDKGERAMRLQEMATSFKARNPDAVRTKRTVVAVAPVEHEGDAPVEKEEAKN